MTTNPNKNLIRRLKAQIAVAKEVDGDFAYITIGDAKRILRVLEEKPNGDEAMDISKQAVNDNERR